MRGRVARVVWCRDETGNRAIHVSGNGMNVFQLE